MLQADNNMEYVIEAADVDDMKSWLATIKYCMRAAPTTQPPPDALPGMPEPAPPDLPPRRDLPASTSNADLATDTPEEAELGMRIFKHSSDRDNIMASTSHDYYHNRSIACNNCCLFVFIK